MCVGTHRFGSVESGGGVERDGIFGDWPTPVFKRETVGGGTHTRVGTDEAFGGQVTSFGGALGFPRESSIGWIGRSFFGGVFGAAATDENGDE